MTAEDRSIKDEERAEEPEPAEYVSDAEAAGLEPTYYNGLAEERAATEGYWRRRIGDELAERIRSNADTIERFAAPGATAQLVAFLLSLPANPAGSGASS